MIIIYVIQINLGGVAVLNNLNLCNLSDPNSNDLFLKRELLLFQDFIINYTYQLLSQEEYGKNNHPHIYKSMEL